MKRKIKNGMLTLLCAATLAGFTACDADPVNTSRGELTDNEALENTYVMIRSAKSSIPRAVVSLTEGTTTATDKIYCRLTHPAERAMSITAAPDESLVEVFNATHETDFGAMPAANVLIANNGAMAVTGGERASGKLEVTFKADGLAAGKYLLPIAISSGEITFTEENRVLYYLIEVRGLDMGDYELDTEYLTVFYVNTSIHQPLLADNFKLEKKDYSNFTTVWERLYGNIVNLRIVQIGYDPTAGRAMLLLNSDIRYVLEHANKYIRPLQDKGRKVCLSIEGSGSGLGFCNLSDEQIADFTAQVKACVEWYALDGINFCDKNSGYGEEGMPPMNTTSYPKLIKAMREALGANRLVTLVDYEEPTAYFWDTEATGGISAGQYLDYAWSGYASEQEGVQLLDPWQVIDPNNQTAKDWGLIYPTTKYARKPIAGLSPEQYGYFALPFYSHSGLGPFYSSFINFFAWRQAGWSPNNIVVYSDLRTNEQGEYEGAQGVMPNTFWYYYPFDGAAVDWIINYNAQSVVYVGYYGYLRKDW